MAGGRSNITQVVTVIAIGIVGWVSAGVIALAVGADGKIVWTCVVGAALGLIGLRYSIRRLKREAN